MKDFLVTIISKFFVFYFTYRYFGKVFFGKNVVLNWRFSFSGKGKLFIGDGVKMWAHEEWNRVQTYSASSVVTIGKNSKINGALFQSRKSIIIGDNCMIGSALFLDNDFHYSDPLKRHLDYQEEGSTIAIEKNVWVAGQAVILKGVRIGENSVVALRSVVSKNVEKNIIVGGNPAKKIKDI